MQNVARNAQSKKVARNAAYITTIHVRKTEPLKMYYKYSVQKDVEFSCMNFAKKGRKRKDVSDLRLRLLHPQQPRPLSTDKVKDLQKLLKYVPPVHHDLYTRLVNSTVDNVSHMCEDELLGQSDAEVEAEASPPAENSVLMSE